MKKYNEKDIEALKAKIEGHLKLVDKKIELHLNTKEEMENYLKFMAKFYDYSNGNRILIEKQFTGAEAVGSFKFWKEKGFAVKRGEKGVKILVPCFSKYLMYENGDTKNIKYASEEELEKVKRGEIKTKKKLCYYMEGNVFDISQTTAKTSDLPKIFPNRWLEGDISNYSLMYKGMENIAEKIGAKIVEPYEELGVAKGITYGNKEIALNPRNSQLQNVKTLLHELAHAKLHGGKKHENYTIEEREFQAEMVAYTTCSYLKIDTSEYSLDYIKNWTKDTDIRHKKDLLKEVSDTVKEYIEILELTLEKERALTKANNNELDNNKEKENDIKDEGLKLENTYVKFTSSTAKEIEKGDSWEFNIANELIEMMEKKCNIDESKHEIKIKIYKNEKCTQLLSSELKFSIGDGKSKDLGEHISVAVKNSEMNIKETSLKENILNKFNSIVKARQSNERLDRCI
ncbi:TPA: ImmA/IrrE family metallo-endopeptidase [Clostridioides difficile]|uniref:ImmA/IrrE family metallo-endopeptidase n=1 Tax=Clostridioides difficile TaxID=1496 RepID=UPI000824D3BC|nr:ImmA/IrrE family metallo-endopeptidase [Clostridioides difficile]MDV9854150.1 ArdC-like ssDNA-binding domain-containing protein [Clostridioides difficile]HBE9726956.1 ImmA/IrrE family metallo-endopeptidase [Clostridioides difficile]HBF1102431.1 ImmA/IrrE family metallo-endopeptidase [Clostridioides difficile]HBF1291732.1 ImmA/IrrE family metallo-endopeptidase [Clostridioides difficile]HBF3343003.1 ImmA/IrrE family metallo-endopeptidase [Clostridioides difficile]